MNFNVLISKRNICLYALLNYVKLLMVTSVSIEHVLNL